MKRKLVLFFIIMFCLCLNAEAKKILSDSPIISHRIHNEQGERVGTVKRENNKFKLYDMHERVVQNPAKFMNQPADECFLYDVMGYAIGKCTATRVILWH